MSCLVASRGDCGFWGVTLGHGGAERRPRRRAMARTSGAPVTVMVALR
jgi:hypothetical protein